MEETNYEISYLEAKKLYHELKTGGGAVIKKALVFSLTPVLLPVCGPFSSRLSSIIVDKVWENKKIAYDLVVMLNDFRDIVTVKGGKSEVNYNKVITLIENLFSKYNIQIFTKEEFLQVKEKITTNDYQFFTQLLRTKIIQFRIVEEIDVDRFMQTFDIAKISNFIEELNKLKKMLPK